MKKAVALFISLCLLINLSLVQMFAQAVSPVSFSLKTKEEKGTVTVTVSLSGTVENAGGMQLSLSYDTKAFRYVGGSRKILLSALDASDVNRDAGANGTVPFLADRSEAFTVTGNIVSYQFEVLASQAGDKVFTLTINDFYYLDSSLSSVPITSKTVTSSTSVGDVAVQQVIDKIKAIGAPITLQSETDIKAARAAYNALNIQQKRQVTNLDVLAAAERELARLQSESSDSVDEKAATAYRQTHATVLSRTVETLKLEDKALLQEALADFAEQSLEVRILLNPDKNLLNRLNTRMKELEKIQADKEADDQLKAEAKEMAADFIKQWNSFITLDIEKVTDQHLTGLNQAVGQAESTGMINSYFLEYIKVEYDHLKALKEAANNYKGNAASPDEVAITRFISAYGYLFYIKPENITRDEEVDVRTAIAYYDMMSQEAQEMLGSEVMDYLKILLAAIEALPPEENAPSVITPDPEIIYKDREVIKEVKVPGEAPAAPEKDAETALVNVVTRGMTSAVWWLLGTLLATLILSGVAAVILIQLKKKQEIITGKEEA